MEIRAISPINKARRQDDLPCKYCGQPLVEIGFNSQYYMSMCDNVRCLHFREPQGTRERSSV